MVAQVPMLHVRFAGRSVDVPLGDLDVSRQSSDRQIKQAAAAYLDLSAHDLHGYVIDRHQTDNLTIRPEAVYG